MINRIPVLWGILFAPIKSAMIFKPSLDIHDGSVSIEGPNQTARSSIEAAVRCACTTNCHGFWAYDDGLELVSQTGVCPAVPHRPNNVENHFHFVITMARFTKGDAFCVALKYVCKCHTLQWTSILPTQFNTTPYDIFNDKYCSPHQSTHQKNYL